MKEESIAKYPANPRGSSKLLRCDGPGNITTRSNTYADYPAHRALTRLTTYQVFSTLDEESESIATQMMRLLDYLKCLPVNISIIDKIEADDTIAYLSNKLEDEVIIYSADQDFLQLVNNKVTVFSPIKKKFYKPQDVFDQYGLYPHNFITMKCLMGDKSDNISPVFPQKRGKAKAKRYYNEREFFKEELKIYNVEENYNRNRLLIDFNMIPENLQKEFMASI